MRDLLITPFEQGYMWRALLELLCLSVVGAVCGVHVVLRRLAFLPEALQHTVFPGIAIAFLAQGSLLAGAVGALVLTVVMLTFLTRNPKVDQDAALAVLISLFFAFGVVLVSRNPSYQHDLTTLLFGRILAVDEGQLLQTAAIGLVVLLLLGALHKELIMRAFDVDGTEASGYRVGLLDVALNLAIALVVVAAVQAIGTVLLVAFLITPAAAGRLAFGRVPVMFVFAAALGSLSSWIGLSVSYELSINHDVRVAAGAAVVACTTASFVIVATAVALKGRLARKAAS